MEDLGRFKEYLFKKRDFYLTQVEKFGLSTSTGICARSRVMFIEEILEKMGSFKPK